MTQPIQYLSKTYNNKSVLETLDVNTVNLSGTLTANILDVNTGTIDNLTSTLITSPTASITTLNNCATISNGAGNIAINNNVLMGTKNISNVGTLSINGMITNIGNPDIQVGDDIDMTGNAIVNVTQLSVNVVDAAVQVIIGKGTVTQITNITTGVTVNANAGVITTVSTTLAAGATADFTVTNGNCVVTSVVLANIVNYSGANGHPNININNVANGSFVVRVSNYHALNALDGVLKIAFLIV